MIVLRICDASSGVAFWPSFFLDWYSRQRLRRAGLMQLLPGLANGDLFPTNGGAGVTMKLTCLEYPYTLYYRDSYAIAACSNGTCQ